MRLSPQQIERFYHCQSLYDRLYKGKLTPIYWYNELRFLRSEIEEWKTRREQRKGTSKHEE